MSDEARIGIGHGSGGKLTRDLIDSVFKERLTNDYLSPLSDSAICPALGGGIAFSTDSFVVSPLFFPGGDIGKLAVAGTVNDLAVVGAIPRFLSLGIILEEGFELEKLKTIVDSIARTAGEAGVQVVTGDTKVVEKGKGDGVFINTAGIGEVRPGFPLPAGPAAGDKILVSGPVGDHGALIMSLQSGIDLSSDLESDCAVVSPLIETLKDSGARVKFMRDPTRGGLAAVLNELAGDLGLGVEIAEDSIPLREQVVGIAELLGIEPLQLACEGRIVVVVDEADAGAALAAMRGLEQGAQAAIVGSLVPAHPGLVVQVTGFGGRRIVDMPLSDPLPRIC